MENLQRNVGREVGRMKLPRAARRKRPWTILLVRDNGNVISFKGFKGLVICLFLLLLFSLAADVGLYYLMTESKREKDTLQSVVDKKQTQLVRLADEKKVLMQQLVDLESTAESPSVDAEPSGVNTPAAVPEVETGAAAPAPVPVSTTGQGTEAEPVVEEENVPAPASDPQEGVATTGKVQVEDFNITYQEAGSVLKVSFVIRNRQQEKGPVSGRTFLILKKDADDERSWVTTPGTELASGVPATPARGQFFSISFFKPVTFSIDDFSSPELLTRTTIFVFDTDGELMLEQSFPIAMTSG